MPQIDKRMKKVLIGFIVALTVALWVTYSQLQEVQKKYEVAEANVKAYSNSLINAQQKTMALQLTVDQLEYFKDSVLMELDHTRKELKIADKNLKALQRVASSFTKTDTITVPGDTIFKDPELKIDTITGDKWYTLKLGLEYPSMIVVKPEFKSEKDIIVSSKKETVNPPKKFFLFRWFQKRHVVIHVDVVEKNPYVENEISKYVEILK